MQVILSNPVLKGKSLWNVVLLQVFMACKKTPERVPKRTTPGIIGPLLNTSEERTLEIDFI